MRALVAAETSGSLRNAFETVITETPAYWAMSLSRSIIRSQKAEGARRNENRFGETSWKFLHSAFCILPFSFTRRLLAIAICGATFRETNCPPDASAGRH